MTANDFINSAKKYLGHLYVWGGESDAEGGYDCSGFLYRALNDAGYACIRSTANGYSKMGTQIPVGQQKAGDCLFFGNPVVHCAIYLGNGQMIESRGSRSNTKSNPGTGVVISNVSRRNDLTVVRRFWDAQAIYRVGQNYTTKVDHLHVRYSPWGQIKGWQELSEDGKKHAYSDGCLKKGTTVTVQSQETTSDGAIWARIPSGWICAMTASGEVYL